MTTHSSDMKKIAIGAASATFVSALVLSAGAAAHAGINNTNSAKYWSNETGLECTKLPDSVDGLRSWVAPEDYAVVIVKGGAVNYKDGKGNKVYEDVLQGDVLTAPLNRGGNQAAISHIIVCEGGSVS